MKPKFDSQRLILIPKYLTSSHDGKTAKLLVSVAGRDQCVRFLEYSIMLLVFLLTKARVAFDDNWRAYWSSRLLTSVITLNRSRKLFRVGFFVQIICFAIIERGKRRKSAERGAAMMPQPATTTGEGAEIAAKAESPRRAQVSPGTISKDFLRLCLIVKSIANDIHILTKKNFLAIFSRYENSFLLSYFSTMLLKIVILGFDIWSIVQSASREPLLWLDRPLGIPKALVGAADSPRATSLCRRAQHLPFWEHFTALRRTLTKIGKACWTLATTSNVYQRRLIFKLIELGSKVASVLFRVSFGEYRSIADIPLDRIGEHVHLLLIMCGMVSSACGVADLYQTGG